MKKSPVRIAALLLMLCWSISACKKNHTSSNSTTVASSFSFQATSATTGSVPVHFTTAFAAVQQVDTLHNTLISAQYADTSAEKGNISIRVIGDTTSTYRGAAVLVTYTDASGNVYDSQGDSTDFVTITRFSKVDGQAVSGTFGATVAGTQGTISLTNGAFTAPFLDF